MTILKQVLDNAEIQESAFVTMTASNKGGASMLDTVFESQAAQVMLPETGWSKVRTYCRDAFSEFLGTMILILFGDGVVAQVVLSKGQKGDYQSISWGWG
jgi:aquaglyceroporin related protein